MRISSSKLKVVFKFNTTAHEVRQRARCNNCGVTGNNTYQIVYPGNSDVAMDGAGVDGWCWGYGETMIKQRTYGEVCEPPRLKLVLSDSASNTVVVIEE